MLYKFLNVFLKESNEHLNLQFFYRHSRIMEKLFMAPNKYVSKRSEDINFIPNLMIYGLGRFYFPDDTLD